MSNLFENHIVGFLMTRLIPNSLQKLDWETIALVVHVPTLPTTSVKMMAPDHKSVKVNDKFVSVSVNRKISKMYI